MKLDQATPLNVYQLRIYEVAADKRDIFHSRFKNHALRIMKRYNFSVIALWESASDNCVEFIYMLKWESKAIMDQQWKLFLADNEWIEIKKMTAESTGEPVLKVTSRILNKVEYSPDFLPA